ncbi:MAG: DUF4870 domain-containing protein [Candidatus Hydromicrobium sp.]
MAEEKKVEVHPDFKKKSSTGMDPKVAVLVAHCGFLVGAGWLSGLIIYLIEKENKFVKFHAMQSIVIGVAEVILYIVASLLTLIIVGAFCFPVVWVAALVIRIIIIMKANQGEYYKFPWLGNMADKWTK